MAQSHVIPVVDLLVDPENPRLATGNEGQRETLRALAQEQGAKLAVMAEDILRWGLNPGDPFYVVRLEGDHGQRFVVLEGNRRLAAIRALDGPDLFEGAVKPGVLKKIRQLSRAYRESPVETASCVVFPSRNEARHWIELRHTGEAGGAGIVKWGSDAVSRFQARDGGGRRNAETQVLDFLEKRGDVSPSDRAQVKPTTLRRLVEAPDVRSKLGLELKGGELLYAVEQEQEVADALLWIVGGLISGDITEPKVSTKAQRTHFASELPEEVVVSPIASTSATLVSLGSRPATPATRRPRVNVRAKPRTVLIPRDCVLNVSQPRSRDIERELRALVLTEYPNAISVLFRVFVELSCDVYMEGLKPFPGATERSTLATKLRAVSQHLAQRTKLNAKQLLAVEKSAEKGSLLAPSVELWHQYLHNAHIVPGESDLRAAWDTLQPFMIAVWAP